MCASQTSSRCSEDNRADWALGLPHEGAVTLTRALEPSPTRAFRHPTRRRRLFAVSRGPHAVLSPAWATRAWMGRSDRLLPTLSPRCSHCGPAWCGGALGRTDPSHLGKLRSREVTCLSCLPLRCCPRWRLGLASISPGGGARPPGVPGGAPQPIAAYPSRPTSAREVWHESLLTLCRVDGWMDVHLRTSPTRPPWRRGRLCIDRLCLLPRRPAADLG